MQRLLVGLFVCGCTGPVLADGLDTAQVPADATWVIHVDLDAARESSMGQALHGRLMKQANARHTVESMRNDFGIDATKDLHSATFFDNGFAADHGAAIIEMDHIDRDKLLARLEKEKPGHKTTRHAGHTIYTWKEGKGGRRERQVSGSFYGDRHLVFSRDADQLAGVLDVLDGKRNSLPKDSPLGAGAAPGAIVIARAVDMMGQQTPFRSRVMRETRQLSLTLGEADGEVFMQGLLVADSGQSAVRLRAIIDGFRALARVQAGDDPLARKLMESLTMVVADATIAAEWRAEADDVRQLMEALYKKHRERVMQERHGREPQQRDRGENREKGHDPQR